MSHRRHGRPPAAATDARSIAGWLALAGAAASVIVWLAGSGLLAGLAILACSIALAGAAYALVRWRVFALPARAEEGQAPTDGDGQEPRS
jgi:hypothetical protein